jgi:hypothetical protein
MDAANAKRSERAMEFGEGGTTGRTIYGKTGQELKRSYYNLTQPMAFFFFQQVAGVVSHRTRPSDDLSDLSIV